MDKNFEKGDILRYASFKLPPFHYAVYIGDGYIVHYNNTLSGKSINIFSKNKATIMKETLEEYKARLTYTCVIITKIHFSYAYRTRLLWDVKKVTYTSLVDSQKSPEEIKERALQAFQEQAVKYNAVFTNCEHFATWCVYGKKVSVNVRVVATGGTMATTTLAGGGTGVLIGGAIGTAIVPVVGTVIGGFIGAAIGATAGAGLGATTSGVTTAIVHAKTEETEKL